MEDLRRIGADPKLFREVYPLIDPDTGRASDWLVFDPVNDDAISDEGRIIAAAPRSGGPNAGGSDQRMVMIETGRVMWIAESHFIDATRRQKEE